MSRGRRAFYLNELLVVLGLAAFVGGCDQEGAPVKKSKEVSGKSSTAVLKPKGQIGPNVFLKVEGDKRSVHINATVCLRQGQMEQFLTRTKTKEHEAILAADVDARHIHAALIAAGAEQGKPVQFAPKYVPASGGRVKVLVQYQSQGQLVTLPAQKWIRHIKTGKELEHEWLFVGSRFFQDPEEPNKTPFYAANQGDVICISNFDTALLDLPIVSSRANDELLFEAFTERIPPEKTPVVVILEPVRP